MKKIPLFKPFIDSKEIDNIKSVFDSIWLGMGKNTYEFEEKIKNLLNLKNRYVLSCNTGFSALHLALISMNLKSNDEVIIPSFSNVANLQTILNLGLKPVFCDIDEKTLCIDVNQLKKKINKKTKVIMFIDYAFTLADYFEINKIAKKNKIKIIHDAAHSFGSKCQNKFIGNFFDYTMFSFDPIKTITSIDGGALVIKNKNIYLKLKRIRNMGITEDNSSKSNKRSKKRDVINIGLRYHLSNVNASVGISQLNKFKIISKKRNNLVKYYQKLLSNEKNIYFPDLKPDIVPFIFYIRVNKIYRNKLMSFLSKQKIETGIHWRPLHSLYISRNINKSNLNNTNRISKEIITMPLYPELTNHEIKYITSKINLFFKTYKNNIK